VSPADASPADEPAAIPLLETKLRAPRSRRGVVARPRLDPPTGPDHPALTLVSAPAGFGKTTLLTEWLARWTADGASIAWLSLDPADNDPALFVSYLVAALQKAVPNAGESARSLIRSSPSAVQDAVSLLLNDLATDAHEIVLVLDDYHVISAPDIHEAVAFFVDHLPPHVRLVLASRADPPLPLARLRVRGDLLEVRAAELRFTADEASAYLNESMGLRLDATDVSALESRTEGWIAALQLAALSLQGRDDVADFIASFTGDDRFVVDYLVEEVLERQDPLVRSFLLQTSVLDRLTGSLCDAVTQRSGGKATLEALDRANLFLVALDDRREWYRYHHLFADVLRARVLDEQPEIVRDLHRRAGDWYEARGDRPDAIAHAIAGRDVDRAAELVELAAPEMRRTRQEATLRRWLEALPAELFTARPVLAVTLVGARMATGDTTGASALLDGVESWLAPTDGAPPPSSPIVFDDVERARLPEQVAIYRSGLALLAGDIEGTLTHADRALALAPPTDHLARGAASALQGLARWRTADLDAARHSYSVAVASLTEAEHFADVMGCSLGLADIQIAQGRLGDAVRTFDAALAHATAHPGLRGAADMHVGLAEVHLARNDIDGAVGHLEAAERLGEQAGLPQHAYRWRVATARLRHAQGDLTSALDLLTEAERFYDTDFSPSVQPIPAIKARMHVANGDLAAAERWVTDSGLGVLDEPSYLREFEHVTLARILLARRDRDAVGEAIGLMTRLLAAANEGGRRGTAVELLVLLALAHQASGDRDAARESIEAALVLAAPEGYVRVFLDEGPAMTALLQSVAARGAPGDHARRILAAERPPAAAVQSTGRGLAEELSSRELDVLRLLRSELSGPDIARELFVSLNTMRTHTKNIYAKLGVSNRREAVRRAAELGL
jgi:LuxR family maltose regulon positive regulatory protein